LAIKLKKQKQKLEMSVKHYRMPSHDLFTIEYYAEAGKQMIWVTYSFSHAEKKSKIHTV
jgi:hypothetical protein